MKLARNVIRDKNGEVLQINSLRTAEEFADKFFSQSDDLAMKGGSRKYATFNGFASRGYAEELPSQGHVKLILSSLKVLFDRAAEGDSEAAVLIQIVSSFIKSQLTRTLKGLVEGKRPRGRRFA